MKAGKKSRCTRLSVGRQVGTKAVLSETNGTHAGNETGSGRKWMPFPGRKRMTNDFVVTEFVIETASGSIFGS